MTPPDDAERVRLWRRASLAAVCDVVRPWDHGTVVRATDYPGYRAFNLVRVEDDPRMSVDALAAFADDALAGLGHRRLDFEVVRAADSLRAGFEARGWTATRLVWLRHAGRAAPAHEGAAVEVPYDEVSHLRTAWHREDSREDSPEPDPTPHHAQAREVARRRRAQVLAVRDGGTPVGFAELHRAHGAAEITEVFVLPAHRGAGYGTSLTLAAIEAAGRVDDLWICADDAGRAKHLYARLGFRPVWREMEFELVP